MVSSGLLKFSIFYFILCFTNIVLPRLYVIRVLFLVVVVLSLSFHVTKREQGYGWKIAAFLFCVGRKQMFLNGFQWGSCYPNFGLLCMFCRSLFVLLSFFYWSLICLFLFDLWILITPLISSKSTYIVYFNHCINK